MRIDSASRNFVVIHTHTVALCRRWDGTEYVSSASPRMYNIRFRAQRGRFIVKLEKRVDDLNEKDSSFKHVVPDLYLAD